MYLYLCLSCFTYPCCLFFSFVVYLSFTLDAIHRKRPRIHLAVVARRRPFYSVLSWDPIASLARCLSPVVELIRDSNLCVGPEIQLRALQSEYISIEFYGLRSPGYGSPESGVPSLQLAATLNNRPRIVHSLRAERKLQIILSSFLLRQYRPKQKREISEQTWVSVAANKTDSEGGRLQYDLFQVVRALDQSQSQRPLVIWLPIRLPLLDDLLRHK